MRKEPDRQFEQLVQALFEEHFGSLFRYLDRLSGDSEIAADIAQEAFVRLYQRGRLPDEPRAWLAAVANNLLRDDRRRTQRRAVLLERNSKDDLRAADSPDAALMRDEREAMVRTALDALSPRDRQMLLLRHEGFSYREISRAVSVAESSVGTLLVRATESFRASFTERYGASE